MRSLDLRRLHSFYQPKSMQFRELGHLCPRPSGQQGGAVPLGPPVSLGSPLWPSRAEQT